MKVSVPTRSAPKEQVRRLLERLPEEATLEDIQYHIYVREKIQAGRRAVEENRVLSQEDAERRLSKWLAE